MYLYDFHHEAEGFVEDVSFCTVTDRGSGEDYKARNFMIFTTHQILFVCSNQEDCDWQGM
jgi:hypothetical protein